MARPLPEWLSDRVGQLERKVQQLSQQLEKERERSKTLKVQEQSPTPERKVSRGSSFHLQEAGGYGGAASPSASSRALPGWTVTPQEALESLQIRLKALEEGVQTNFAAVVRELDQKIDTEVCEQLIETRLREAVKLALREAQPGLADSSASHTAASKPVDAAAGQSSAPCNIVVSYTPQGSTKRAQVTVEADVAEPLSAVKRRAHEQLQTWYRFCSAGVESKSGDDGSVAGPPLPELDACVLQYDGVRRQDEQPSLSEVSSHGAGHLSEQLSLAHCGLTNGAHLELQPRRQAPQVSPAPIQGDFLVKTPSPRAKDPSPKEPTFQVVVAYCGSEIHLAVGPSENVGRLKQRAHEQLETGCEFTSEMEAAFPALEDCRLHAAGRGDGLDGGPRALDESLTVVDCSLTEGAQLYLRPRPGRTSLSTPSKSPSKRSPAQHVREVTSQTAVPVVTPVPASPASARQVREVRSQTAVPPAVVSAASPASPTLSQRRTIGVSPTVDSPAAATPKASFRRLADAASPRSATREVRRLSSTPLGDGSPASPALLTSPLSQSEAGRPRPGLLTKAAVNKVVAVASRRRRTSTAGDAEAMDVTETSSPSRRQSTQ
eukprot:TRINITY_DN8937_c0_g1_i1.p1 TRINITY_DN8937_c0_g1~~TRINITY_DN8937_c0_g1_i1.p1  ORF type:complete len:605 (-),score=104.84 TRINITY_DN8937_c0_g1_i1:323-2137(-)